MAVMVLSALLLVVVALVPSVVAMGTEPPPPRALAGVWGAAPWLDGDGVPELAVGAYTSASSDDYRGAVWVLFLRSNVTVNGHQRISTTAGN